MKHTLLAFLLQLACRAGAQTVPTPFESRLVDSTQATKAELYTRAYSWIASNYGSANAVIQMADKDAGKIIGKAASPWPVLGGFGNLLCKSGVHYTLTIDVKDGKYRCVLSDFYHKGCFTGKYNSPDGGALNGSEPAHKGSFLGGMSMNDWKALKARAAKDAQTTLVSFGKALQTPSANHAATVNDGY